MRRYLLIGALLATLSGPLAGGARADDGASTAPPDAAADEDAPADDGPDEEIIVLGRREIARRRAALDRDLKEQGYKAKDREGVTVYRPEVYWKPSVFVYDDGYVILRRTPPRFEPYVAGTSNLRYLACIPPFTVMCVKLSGWLVSERKLTPQKNEVISSIQPEVRAWQGAISHDVMTVRLGTEIPSLLVGTWERGEPMEPGEPGLPTVEERRRAILRFWATRADTPEGDAVRAVVADFFELVVQESDNPATPDEIAAAEALCACGELLPKSPPTPRSALPEPPPPQP